MKNINPVLSKNVFKIHSTGYMQYSQNKASQNDNCLPKRTKSWSSRLVEWSTSISP